MDEHNKSTSQVSKQTISVWIIIMSLLKQLKVLIIILLIGIGILSTGIGSSTMRKVEEVVFDINSAKKSCKEIVKNGHFESSPKKTINEAFNSFFGEPNWKYFYSSDERDIVEFSGKCEYEKQTVTAKIQFIVNRSKGTFELGATTFNDVPQNLLIQTALISKTYEEHSDSNQGPSGNDNEKVSGTHIDNKTNLHESKKNTQPTVNAQSDKTSETINNNHTRDDLYTKLYLSDESSPSLIDQDKLISSVKNTKFNAFGNKTIGEVFSEYFTDGNWFLESASQDTPFYYISFVGKSSPPKNENIKISFECNNLRNYVTVDYVLSSSSDIDEGSDIDDDEIISLFEGIYD